jgi:arabinogalactan oligomer/maltooligosaccharide transport system permease protein
MIFELILVIYLILLLLLVNQGTVNDYAIKKGYESRKYFYLAFIPVYGFIYFKNKPNLKDTTEREFKHLLSFEILGKRFLLYTGLLIALSLVLIPLAILVFLSLRNATLFNMFIVFMIILLKLMLQGLLVDYASKRGYEGILPGVIGITFPILGFLYYTYYLPKRRNVSRQAIFEIFKLSNLFSRFLVYAQITFMTFIVLVPVIYIFGMAFANVRSGVPPSSLWPETPTWEAFRYLFEETNFKKWYWNTLSIALINMFAGTILITGAAYVFARFSFKGKKAGLLSILVLQAFPSFMGLIAMYVLFWKFNILGQPRWLSVLYIGGSIPGNLWLIKGFLSQIPKDLDESAMIDGANKLQIFFKIILPLSVPILTFVAVGMFMGPWMDYMLPGYLLRFPPANAPDGYDITNQWTLAIGLFRFINDLNYQHYSAFAAGALMVGIPITILYMLFQRYLIEGIMAGATKG